MSKEDKSQKPAKANPNPSADPDSELPPDADIEERFNDFWKRNGPGIFAAIALGAVIVLGVQGYQYAGERAEQAAQAAYQDIETLEDQITFAESHRKHRISGIAFLEAADESYENGNFEKAAALYREADQIFREGFFRSRARLGLGLSLVLKGEVAEAERNLQAVVNDSLALDQIRAEAAYHLAVLRWEQENFSGVRAALDVVFTLPNAGFWTMQASDLQERIPELAALGEG